MTIRENYLAIRENMLTACARAGRSVDEITLVGVTKFIDMPRIAEAIACGMRDVGENRVQEWQSKYDFFTAQQAKTHLIGQMQTNKVKYIINKGVCLIQSVDRLSLAQEIERQCRAYGCTQDVLLEVNIGGEAQKGGVAVDALPQLLSEISALTHVRVQGLMCVPPAVGAGEARRYFAAMRTLFEKCAGHAAPNIAMRCLSMGMSGDYMAALEEGATMIRVGTALFGARFLPAQPNGQA